MTLAFHKAPKQGESAPGYLLRLADKNGYSNLPELLKDTITIGAYRSNSHIDKLSELAKILGTVACDSLLEPKSVKINAIQAQPLIYKPVLTREPRVCASCMAEGSEIKADWHVMQITHCTKHKQPLTSYCTCGKPFKWDETLISYGCSSCGKAWFEFDVKAEEMPDFLTAFFQRDIGDRAGFISDVTAAALTRVRPYDSIIDIHHISPKHSTCWIKFLNDGYELLTNAAVYEVWIESCADARKSFRALGNRAVFYPFYRLKSQLTGEWEIKAKSPTLANTSPTTDKLGCELRSLNNKRNIMATAIGDSNLVDDAYIHHIDRDTLADMLQIDVLLSRALFKLPVLESYTNKRLKRNNISCIKGILNIINTSEPAASLRLIPLSEILPFAQGFGATMADVLLAIFRQEIPSYIDVSTVPFLEGIKVKKLELMEYLSGPFLHDKTRTFSMTQVTKILGLPRNLIAQIASEGVIEEVPSPKNHHNYKATSIAKFLEEYIVISIWTDVNNLCEQKVIAALKNDGFTQCWGHNVYKKSKSLIGALESISTDKTCAISQQLVFDDMFQI